MMAWITARRLKSGREEEFRTRWAGGSAPEGMVDALLLQDETDPHNTLSISLWNAAEKLVGYRMSEEARRRDEELNELVDKRQWSRGFVAWRASELPTPGRLMKWKLLPAVIAVAGAGAFLLVRKRRGGDTKAEAERADSWERGAEAHQPVPLEQTGSRPRLLVRDLMTPDPACVDHDTDLTTAAQKMKDLNVGFLPIMADGKLAGVVTDRDITLALADKGRRPDQMRVADVMSEVPATVPPHVAVEEASRIMADHQVRRLPVVEEGTRLVGIISLGDLAADGAEPAAGKALERISQPAKPQR